MSMVGQSRSLDIFICMLKIREQVVMRSSFFGIGKAKVLTLLT